MPTRITRRTTPRETITTVYQRGGDHLEFPNPRAAFNFATQLEFEKTYNTFQSFVIFPKTHPLWSLGFAWDLKIIRKENQLHLIRTDFPKLNATQVALRTILLPRAHLIKCKDVEQAMRFSAGIRTDISLLKSEKDLTQDTSDLTFHLSRNHEEILITSPHFEKSPIILNSTHLTDLGPAPELARKQPTYVRQNTTLRNFRQTSNLLRQNARNK